MALTSASTSVLSFLPEGWAAMALYYGMVGVGSQAAYLACISVTAQNFPSRVRGTALGLPISIFGLSALLFSTLDAIFLDPNDPESATSLLWILAGSCFLANMFGSMRLEVMEKLGDGAIPDPNSSHQSCPADRPFFTDPSAWILALLLLITTGSGITYINNVGAFSRAWDLPVDTTAIHVASFSLTSALARAVVGWASDLKHGCFPLIPPLGIRLIWLGGATVGISLCQAWAWAAPGDGVLQMVTLATGFFYGALFTLTPTIVSEWWGSLHFASHWAYLSLAPGLGGAFFNYLYGLVLDSTSKEECHGRACYSEAFVMTGIACGLCTGLVVILHLKHQAISSDPSYRVLREPSMSEAGQPMELGYLAHSTIEQDEEARLSSDV